MTSAPVSKRPPVSTNDEEDPLQRVSSDVSKYLDVIP